MKKQTTAKQKPQNKFIASLKRSKLVLPVFFALVAGVIGTYMLTGSNALSAINPPTNLTVSVTSPTSARLYWFPSTTTPAPSYNIFRDDVKVGTVAVWISLDGRVSYGDSGLTPNTSYTYYVQALSDDGTTTANSTPVTITTPSAPTANQLGTITGTVTGNRKAPISGAELSIVFNGVTNRYYSAADGKFSIPNVPAGSYSVGVSASGYKSASPRVNVVGGQTVNLPVSLKIAR